MAWQYAQTSGARLGRIRIRARLRASGERHQEVGWLGDEPHPSQELREVFPAKQQDRNERLRSSRCRKGKRRQFAILSFTVG
jgi:hypothetical protein